MRDLVPKSKPSIEHSEGDVITMRYLTGVILLASAHAGVISAQDSGTTRRDTIRVIPPAEQQIAAAVLAAPKEFRDAATVLGYGPDGHLRELRHGTGALICLANDPAGERFHVACYHRSLEPFMARGRALRARGVKGDRVDSLRFAEVRSGRLHMPARPATLYNLAGPADSFDPATGTAPKAHSLYVIYVPNATGASLGLPEQPVEGVPWIMDPGTPKAHIMFVPKM
jgi:hypothetical protein